MWLGGCATRIEPRPADAGDEASARRIAFQSNSISPGNGGQIVLGDALRSGDILLSSSPNFISAAIRAFTVAPVSHAGLFIGNDTVVEAVGGGVRRQSVMEVLDDSAVVVALRHPRVEEPHANTIHLYALSQVGKPYNHFGIVLQAPFSLQRRICELPLLSERIRDGCIRGIGAIQFGAVSQDKFFCSQLVLEAYRQAGLPMTRADSRLVSPADLLHMREGDIPSIRIDQALEYVGHLKYRTRREG